MSSTSAQLKWAAIARMVANFGYSDVRSLELVRDWLSGHKPGEPGYKSARTWLDKREYTLRRLEALRPRLQRVSDDYDFKEMLNWGMVARLPEDEQVGTVQAWVEAHGPGDRGFIGAQRWLRRRKRGPRQPSMRLQVNAEPDVWDYLRGLVQAAD